MIKEKGTPNQVSFLGSKMNIFYFIYDDPETNTIYWYFENNDQWDGMFEGVFNFKLTNLELDDHTNRWVIHLKRGQKVLRKMHPLNVAPNVETSYQTKVQINMQKYTPVLKGN